VGYPAGYWSSGYWFAVSTTLPFGSAAAQTIWPAGDQAACSGLNGAMDAWSGIAATPSGLGFFLVSVNGGVMGCGDAKPVGGVTNWQLAAPSVGIASTPDGGGYWIVGADGGVFAIGDAAFYGSVPEVLPPGQPLNGPIVGIAATQDGGGYWVVGADGGVFSFGDAAFFGSMSGQGLNGRVCGIAANPDGPGYWLAASDGGVFAFGGAPFEGSVPEVLPKVFPGDSLAGPIVGIAAVPN
jgi:hypothetical protein